MQGVNLVGTRLQGIRTEPELPLDERVVTDVLFPDRIRNRTDWQSDLSGATFEDGLTRADLGVLLDGVPDEKTRRLRETLAPHLDRPADHQLSEASGAVVGSYAATEVDRWIAEYQDAMSEIPRARIQCANTGK